MDKEKKEKELTAKEKAEILSAELAPYPCFNCANVNKSCDYSRCWKYRTWFRLKWKEVTDRFKRRR